MGNDRFCGSGALGAILILAMGFGVPAAEAAGAPDLEFTALSAKVSSGKIVVSCSFQNKGTASTPATFGAAFYLSRDASKDASDVLLGSWTRTSSLSAGSTGSKTLSFAAPVSLPPNDYYIIGVLDPAGLVSESNEANNARASAASVAVRADLLVVSLSASRAGSVLTVSDKVKNQGPLSTSGSFRVDYYLSRVAEFPPPDVLLGSRTVSLPVAYGAADAAATPLAIPPTILAGSYRVRAVADAGSVVPETSESNNSKVSSALALKLDLVAVSVTASASGRTVTVTESVRNGGPAAAPAFQVDLRLSTDTSVGLSDPLLGRRSVPPLAAGETSTATTTLAAPSTVPDGSYYVGIWADGSGAVPETSESNNKMATAAKVALSSGPPNASPVARISASPTSGEAPLTVSFDGSGSTDSDGTIASYAWSFGDGQTGSGATASHTYTAAGTYTATLTVTDDGGAKGSASVVIRAGGETLEFPVSTGYEGTATRYPKVRGAASGDQFLVAWGQQVVDPYSPRHGWYERLGIRFRPDGSKMDPAPLTISTANEQQGSPVLGSAGSQYLALWSKIVGGEIDLFGTRVNGADGTVLNPNGVGVIEHSMAQSGVQTASIGDHYLMVWMDTRSGTHTDIYGARMDSAGRVLDGDGFLISSGTNPKGGPVVAAAGGVYLVAWHEQAVGTWKINGRRIGADGKALGVQFPISGGGDQSNPMIAATSSQFFVAWKDGRRSPGEFYPSVYGTRVSTAGAVLDSGGRVVAKESKTFASLAAVADQYLLVWQDDRNGVANDDIYGARVTTGGAVLDPDGFPICTAPAWQMNPSVSASGNQYLVVWDDARDGRWDIYARRVSP